MLLPTTFNEVIFCLALTLLCWGSWANFQRRSGKWRYELFFWDFSWGVLLAAVVAAFTLGSLNTKELTFQDNLLIASYHNIAYGLAAGVLLNLANLMLVAAVSVAPFSVVFPVGMGVGLVIGTGWTLFPAQGSVLLPMGGAVVVLAAIVVNAFTYGTHMQDLRKVKKALSPDPRAAAAKTQALPTAAKGVALSVVGGIAMGMASPLLSIATTPDDGLGAYTAALLIGIAVVVSTAVFSPFFTNFTVHGAPVPVRAYFKGSKAQHLSGLMAGGLWAIGLLGRLASGGTLSKLSAGPVWTRAFEEGAVLVAVTWGWLAWGEFKGSSYRVRLLLTAMLALWVVGAAMLVAAPSFAK